jgi:hypothetical protein
MRSNVLADIGRIEYYAELSCSWDLIYCKRLDLTTLIENCGHNDIQVNWWCWDVKDNNYQIYASYSITRDGKEYNFSKVFAFTSLRKKIKVFPHETFS